MWPKGRKGVLGGPFSSSETLILLVVGAVTATASREFGVLLGVLTGVGAGLPLMWLVERRRGS
jgi:hypothetical protein